MAPLLFTCPTTHRRAPTHVEIDPKSLAAAWKRTLKVECPHCGEMTPTWRLPFKMAPILSWSTAHPELLPSRPRDSPREEPAK
jgi:hypothetical protein